MARGVLRPARRATAFAAKEIVDVRHGRFERMLSALTAVGAVVSAAVLQPFQAAVNALLYVDQRIRKEAYDVELLGRAGILPG